MDLLDVVLIALAVTFAVTGYRQGFIVGVLAVVGLLAGALIGLSVIPQILSHLTPGVLTTVLAICLLVFLAGVGQTLTTLLAVQIRRHVTWRPARVLDAALGSVASVISVLLVVWFLGAAVAGSAISWLPNEVRNSALLQGVTNVMPPSAQTWFADFDNLLIKNGDPEVFAPLQIEPIVSVAPPDPGVVASPVVAQAEQSIVKVLGTANSCGKQIEGSGFVYSPRRVMTNAHVVAGVQHPQVYLSGKAYRATVVLFDPDVDVAVLDVPSLSAPALTFDASGSANDQGTAVGFPENGPLTVVPARVRETLANPHPNIWGQGLSDRQIFSLYARILPGNSGGPLLSENGTVYGVVFAKSEQDDNTGYALTARQVAADALAGESATTQVDTQGCAL